MADYSHAHAPLDQALWYGRHGRTGEMMLDGLSTIELGIVHAALTHGVHAARRRHLKAHAIGASLTAGFLVLGFLLMLIGPAEVKGWSLQYNVMMHGDDQLVWWGILIVMLATGASGADYVLRRRLKLAAGYGRIVAELHQAIARVDARLPERASRG